MARQATDHIDSPIAVGTRLRTSRLAVGLRQADLAFPGCTTGYISRIESGERVPSLQVVRRLAARLGLSEAWLARGALEVDPELELVEAELEMRFDEHELARLRFEALLADHYPNGIRARAEAGLGQLAARAGRNAEAIDHFGRAAAIDPSAAEAGSIEALGRAHAALGNEAQAIAVFRSRYDQARSNDDTPETIRFGVLLANAQIDALDFPSATTTLSFVIGAVPNADISTLARVHWSQARLASLRGDTIAARRHAVSALALLESSDDRRLYAYAHHLLAFAELDAGNPEEALELVERGARILGADATDYDEAAFEIERARALVQLGRLDEGASIAMGAAARFNSLHPVDFGRAYTELATAFLAQGESERAGELYELAIELLASRPTRFLGEAYARYGEYLELRGDPAGALAAYRSSATLASHSPTLAARA